MMNSNKKHSENSSLFFFLIWLFGRPSSNQICIDYIEIPDPFAILRARIFGRFFFLSLSLGWKTTAHSYLYWIHKMANLGNKINITREITTAKADTKTIFTWESLCAESMQFGIFTVKIHSLCILRSQSLIFSHSISLCRSGSHLDNFQVNTAIYRQRYLLAREETCSHHCRIKFELINFRIKANVG